MKDGKMMLETKTMRSRMEYMIKRTQQQICDAIEKLDHVPFQEDIWSHAEGGGGISRVLQNGTIFEKAGVNISIIQGMMSKEMACATRLNKEETEDRSPPFFAAGISVVIHPHNPMVPTAHTNYRYFEVGDAYAPHTWWFGGGADLTPAYLFTEDAIHFHQTHKDVCDHFDLSFYPQFKQQCDNYFYIVHRKERRGIGGIFFEHLNNHSSEDLFAFVSSCAQAFVPAYFPIVQQRFSLPFTESQKRWQQIRRGRYVEFNLVYDRGTAFGFHSGGRTESILMSLPLLARWEYDYQPPYGSPEAQMVEILRTPHEWV
jgi:coproporphyrinogen III oxidase